MRDLDQIAERVWPMHAWTTEAQRARNIEAWKAAVAKVGSRWLALPTVRRVA